MWYVDNSTYLQGSPQSLYYLLYPIIYSTSPTRTKMNPKDEVVPVKRKAGRPKKGEIVAKKKGNRELRGRPAGDKAIMDEYKARMLNSPKSARVLEAIFDAALDPEHKAQSAAWKLIVDRIVPVSSFEQVKQGGGTPAISINIMGLNQASTVIEQDDIEVDISDVEVKNDD